MREDLEVNCYAGIATPQLGDICRGRDLGFSAGHGHTQYIWTECPRCKEQRWAIKNRIKTSKTGFCRKCFLITHIPPPPPSWWRGDRHPTWKGGRVNNGDGYILIRVNPDDFFYPMAQPNGYVLEHRLVMAKSLGRCLQSWEIVHHKNHIRDDNRLENLELISDIGHKQLTMFEKRIKELEQRITLLEAENILLRGSNE